MLNLSLRIASMLLLTILCVEVVSLSWDSPRFSLLVMASGLVIATGLLVFFYDLVAVPRLNQGA